VEAGAIVHGRAIRTRLAALLERPRGRFVPLAIGRDIVGWLDPARAGVVAQFDDIFEREVVEHRVAGLSLRAELNTLEARSAALAHVAEVLAARGLLTAWRDERYAIAAHFAAPPLCLVERAAARFFGIRTYAAHINGLVRGEEATMWLARRSARKALDPGMLDNLVGGGISAAEAVGETVVREAWEEAGIPRSVAASAASMGEIRICRSQPDGLQRETVFVHDLWLAADFAPANQDGEAVEHRLVSLREAGALVAHCSGPDVVTADASLVIVDFLLRCGRIDPYTDDGRALGAMRYPSLDLVDPDPALVPG
jgi:8-oxo-dGTP pyrophosphatase MutT (NUDIX family)